MSGNDPALSMNGFGPGHNQPPSPPELPRSLDIEIDPPIDWNGQLYTTLHLEEPVGQMVHKAETELANGASFYALRSYQFALVSNASGVPRAVIEKMRISQIKEAGDFLSRFISGGPPIGGI